MQALEPHKRATLAVLEGLRQAVSPCTMWYTYQVVQGDPELMQTRYSAERRRDASAAVVHRCLANYVHHHRRGGYLPPTFSNQKVLSGGIGDGTVIRLSVTLAGRTNTMTWPISELPPGRASTAWSR
jgi:hypothetical protein